MPEQEPGPAGDAVGLAHPDGKDRPAADKQPRAEAKTPDIVRVACHWAAARGRPAAIYLLAEGNLAQDRPDTPITKTTVIQMANALGGDEFDDLDLVIQSSGGDIHAAYQMMSLLRGHMRRRGGLVACVPGKAQSSATLLCLGADRILLGELGALGPLDAQIRTGVTDAGTPDYTSALHLLKGLNRLQRFSLETFDQAAACLYDHNVSRTEDILKYGIEFSRALTAPLFERIDSRNIGYWDQMLLTGEEYGKRLMEHGDLIEDDANRDRAEHIAQVVHKLVFDYPSHETVIDRDELVKKLDLKAELIEPRLRPFAREFAACSPETLIALIYPPGTKAPPMTTVKASILDWKALKTEGGAREVSWSDSEGQFLMRVGLYRERLISHNPWRKPARRGALAAEVQFAAGEDRGAAPEDPGFEDPGFEDPG